MSLKSWLEGQHKKRKQAVLDELLSLGMASKDFNVKFE